MKRASLLAAMLTILSVPFAAHAGGDHAMSHGGAAMPMAAQDAPMSDGQIRKIDLDKGTITIKHGPLHGLGMGAMTMSFHAADPAMLQAHKPGDMIRFVAVNRDGKLTVARMEAAR